MSGVIGRLSNRVRQVDRPAARTATEAQTFGDGWLTSILSSQDRQAEEKRMGQAYTHVTSLIDFCPRAATLAAETGQPLQSTSSGIRIVWKIGRAVEAHVREQFFLAHRELMFGHWKCACGSLTYTGGHRQSVCPTCKTPADIYGEYTLHDHNAMITGSPDLLIRHEGKLRIVEIKSINKEGFAKLNKPQADHVFQINHYARMLGREAHSTNIILYVKKDFDFKSPYKEFHVPITAQAAGIRNSLEQQREALAARSAGRLPPRLCACVSPTSPTAKACGMVVACFNRR